MITWYMKASDGCICKCEFLTWDSVNYALLCLCEAEDEENVQFYVIDEVEFHEHKNSNPYTKITASLSPKETDILSGYFTEYVPV